MRKLKKLRLSKDLPGVNLYRKDKFAFVFRKRGLSSFRVKTDPAFAVTRSKAACFAHTSYIASRIYQILRPVPAAHVTSTCYKRILAELQKEKNNRSDAHGQTALTILQGFRVNVHSFQQPTLHSLCRLERNDEQGIVNACIPPLHLVRDINAPIGATHCSLALLLAAFNVETGVIQEKIHEEEIIYRLAPGMTSRMDLSLKQPGFTSILLLAVVGVRFFEAGRNEIYSFNHSKSDSTDIMECRLPVNMLNH